MKRIDTTSLTPYYVEDNDAQIAKVGHVNAVIRAINNNPELTAIDPSLNAGITASAEFKKDELTNVLVGTTTYQGYKLTGKTYLNGSSNSYDIFLGFIEVPTTLAGTVHINGVKGNVQYTVPFLATVEYAGLFTPGATVKDATVPVGITNLTFADVYLTQNPFKPSEYYVGLYAEAPTDFEATVNVEIEIIMPLDAGYQYSTTV